MRDIVLALSLLVLWPLSVKRPWVGVMIWTWISLMSPHRQTFGFMNEAPVALITGVFILLGMLLSKDPKRLPVVPPVVWLAAFTGWIVLAFPFSIVPGPEVNEAIQKLLKIFVMTFIAMTVLHSRKQVNVLVAVVALSIGFYGIKGGIFAIATGGQYQVRGGGGFIGPNNELGLALVMIIPLFYYLILQTERKLIRAGLWSSVLLCVIAAIATQSRGAFVAIVAMAVALAVRSPDKKRIVIPMLLCAALIPLFMPDAWWDRMQTISSYDEDASAMGRINAWEVAWKIALSHPFGGGLFYETDEIFARYARMPFVAVAHSIYFQVIGQLGFVGFFLFIGMWISTFITGRWIYRNSPLEADRQLARMIGISFTGYAVGGAFLNFAYFDGPYYLMAALVVMRWKILDNKPLPRVFGGTGKGRPAAARSP